MTLATYQTLFIVFLILAILFIILSIIFFFVFDIKNIFDIKTGRAVRKSVKELNAINYSQDNRKRKKYKGHSIQFDKKQIEEVKETRETVLLNTEANNNSKITVQLEEMTIPLKKEENREVGSTENDINPENNKEEGIKRKDFIIEEKEIYVSTKEVIGKE